MENGEVLDYQNVFENTSDSINKQQNDSVHYKDNSPLQELNEEDN